MFTSFGELDSKLARAFALVLLPLFPLLADLILVHHIDDKSLFITFAITSLVSSATSKSDVLRLISLTLGLIGVVTYAGMQGGKLSPSPATINAFVLAFFFVGASAFLEEVMRK